MTQQAQVQQDLIGNLQTLQENLQQNNLISQSLDSSMKSQHSQLKRHQKCQKQLPLDTPINQQTHIPRPHRSTSSPPSKASPTQQITKNTHQRVTTADTNNSPTSHILSKEVSTNHKSTQPSHSPKTQEETEDYSIAVIFSYEKDRD